MRILHISDLHFPKRIPYFSLRGKAIVGYLNYRLRRRSKYPIHLIQTLVKHIKSLEYDALVISGDLTNVSHPDEFEYAKEILDPILDERTFMIPGNHDRYQKKSISPVPLFEKYFANWMGTSASKGVYLYKKQIGDKTFVGWDSNTALPIAKANGYINPSVFDETFTHIPKDYILVCHHPIWNPRDQVESKGHKLTNRAEVVERLKSHPPIVYLHGHTHSNWIKLPGDRIPFSIVNSASSTRLSDRGHDCGFHEIYISADSNHSHKIEFKRFQFKNNVFSETTPIFFQDGDGVV